MFNQKYVSYLQAVSSLQLASEVRGSIVAAAVASAVANTLPLPTEPVVSPEAYFKQNLQINAAAMISGFNEVAVLNYEQACENVRRFWILRYFAAHGRPSHNYYNDSFAENFSGLNYVFSSDELLVLDKNAADFGRIRNCVASTLVELKNENQ